MSSDKFHDECGVVAVYGHPEASNLTYLGLYGLGRFFLSYLRTDPAVFAGLRQAQLASLVMVIIAVAVIPILFRRYRSTRPAEPEPAAAA